MGGGQSRGLDKALLRGRHFGNSGQSPRQSGDLAESHPTATKLCGLRKVAKTLWASVFSSVK